MPRSTTVLAMLTLAGCAATDASSGWAERRPLGRDLAVTTGTVAPGPAGASEASAPGPAPLGPLTLAEAQRLALLYNPSLAAEGASLRARGAEVDQAGALPNPAIEVTAEDLVLGQDGADAAPLQITTTLRQSLELGGKRAARVEAATRRRDAAGWAFEAERLRVYRDATHAFVELLAAQRRVHNAGEMVGLYDEAVATLVTKEAAGRVTPLEVKRTEVARALARIERERAREQLASARARLAGCWGQSRATFERAQGGFAIPESLPDLDDLRARLTDNPRLRARAEAVAGQRAELDLEQSAAVPDLTVGLGYRWLSERQESALVAELGLPLPLFDANRGQIAAAGHEVTRAERLAEAEAVLLERELEQQFHALRAAHFEVRTLGADVLAEAQTFYTAVIEGYRLGRFGYLDLLDAQRTLFDAVQRSVDARAGFFFAAASVEALVGEPLFDWTPGREADASELGWRRELPLAPTVDLPASTPVEQP